MIRVIMLTQYIANVVLPTSHLNLIELYAIIPTKIAQHDQ
jgi:hypothetical protein